MVFLPNKDGSVASDGTGQSQVQFKKDVKITLNDTLAKFLIKSGAGVEFREDLEAEKLAAEKLPKKKKK